MRIQNKKNLIKNKPISLQNFELIHNNYNQLDGNLDILKIKKKIQKKKLYKSFLSSYYDHIIINYPRIIDRAHICDLIQKFS